MAVGLRLRIFLRILAARRSMTPFLYRVIHRSFPWPTGMARPDHRLADEAVKQLRGSNSPRPKAIFSYYVLAALTLRTSRPRNGSRSLREVRHGYEKLREEIFANQKRLVCSRRILSSPHGGRMPRWDALTPCRRNFLRDSRGVAAYAAYTGFLKLAVSSRILDR